jgi:hypothetical protein
MVWADFPMSHAYSHQTFTDALICIPCVFVAQLGWRSVIVVAGGSARARVSARRRASGSRYRPAIRRTRSAASAAGIPAVVTNNELTQDPRTTGTAWSPRGTRTWPPDHRDAELGVRMRAQAGPTAGIQVGVAAGHQQAQPAQIV